MDLHSRLLAPIAGASLSSETAERGAVVIAAAITACMAVLHAKPGRRVSFFCGEGGDSVLQMPAEEFDRQTQQQERARLDKFEELAPAAANRSRWPRTAGAASNARFSAARRRRC